MNPLGGLDHEEGVVHWRGRVVERWVGWSGGRGWVAEEMAAVLCCSLAGQGECGERRPASKQATWARGQVSSVNTAQPAVVRVRG